jgi:hypothetical protein
MRWDSDLATVVLGLNDNVPNELGFKNFWLVKNQTGSTITKGSIVYANGTVGASGRITVAKFIANGTIDAKYLLGITAHDLTDGEDGYVISFGKIRKVNTDTFAAGAILYPSPTVAGVWTDIEPVAPNLDMPIGFCINSSSNNGTIAIRVASGYKLSELHDLAISSPVDRGSLYYRGGLWRDTTTALLTSDTATMLTNYLRSNVAASTYLPLTGGTITNDLIVNNTFKAKDFGNHTFVNYIQNGDFDLTSTIDASNFNYGYPHYIPLHWKSAATGKYVSTWSSTGGYSSPQHFKQYDGDASTGGALFQDVTNWQDLKGKTVTACGWFTKGTLTNSGSHAEIQINDGLTTTTTSIGTTTSWQRACVTKTISASATRVRVIVGCNLGVSGEGGAVSDIDAISLVVGEGKHEFSAKPLFDRDTQRLSGTLLIGYDSENNLAYNPSATSNLKVAGSTSLNGTLGVSGVTTLSNLIGSGTRMVTASTTGVLSTQAIPSGGSGTVTNVSVGSPANGLSVTNGTTTPVISMALADNGVTGVVSNNTQSFSGSKTFINSIDVNGFTTANGGLIVNANTSTSTLTNLIGISAANGIGKITTGSGLSLTNGVLSVTSSGGGFVTTNSDYTVTITDSWIVFNNNFSNITVTLPNAATSTGRTLYFRNAAAGSIVSAGTANVINNTVTTGTPTNDILGAGNTSVKWCTLVSNGTYWIKIQGGSL